MNDAIQTSGSYAQRLSCYDRFSSKRFNRDLVADFFFLFARTEYALKCSDYVDKGRRNDDATPDWKEFSKSIVLDANSSDELAQAIQYLVSHPPMRQVYKNNGLSWRSHERRAEDSDTKFIIDLVKTVRNNLFHGGKELMTPMTERDCSLIEAALVVLREMVTLNPKVLKAFQDFGPDEYAA